MNPARMPLRPFDIVPPPLPPPQRETIEKEEKVQRAILDMAPEKERTMYDGNKSPVQLAIEAAENAARARGVVDVRPTQSVEINRFGRGPATAEGTDPYGAGLLPCEIAVRAAEAAMKAREVKGPTTTARYSREGGMTDADRRLVAEELERARRASGAATEGPTRYGRTGDRSGVSVQAEAIGKTVAEVLAGSMGGGPPGPMRLRRYSRDDPNATTRNTEEATGKARRLDYLKRFCSA